MAELTKNEIKDLVGKNDPLILEVGSYDGQDSLAMLKVMTDAEIYAFEADPLSIEDFKSLNHPEQIKLIEKL